MGIPNGSEDQESTCNVGNTGDAGSISGLGRSPGGEKLTPVFCLKNFTDRGDWWATVQRVSKNGTRLSNQAWTCPKRAKVEVIRPTEIEVPKSCFVISAALCRSK